jgi:hypothetical protein
MRHTPDVVTPTYRAIAASGTPYSFARIPAISRRAATGRRCVVRLFLSLVRCTPSVPRISSSCWTGDKRVLTLSSASAGRFRKECMGPTENDYANIWTSARSMISLMRKWKEELLGFASLYPTYILRKLEGKSRQRRKGCATVRSWGSGAVSVWSDFDHLLADSRRARAAKSAAV